MDSRRDDTGAQPVFEVALPKVCKIEKDLLILQRDVISFCNTMGIEICERYIDPYADLGFKKLFGTGQNKDLTDRRGVFEKLILALQPISSDGLPSGSAGALVRPGGDSKFHSSRVS